MRRNHTKEFKLECVRQVATGHKRPAQICREHNLSESVLLRWRKEYEVKGEAAFSEKQPSSREEAAVWPLVQQFPDVVSDHWVRYLSTDAGSYYGGTLGFALTFVALEVMRMVRTFTYPKLTLLPGPALPSRLSSGHGFLNLLGVMYLQMYWLLAAGEKHVTRCKYCGKLVRLTARKPGNEGENRDRKPRQDKRYCNDACRQRHHYQTRTKPRRERERSQER